MSVLALYPRTVLRPVELAPKRPGGAQGDTHPRWWPHMLMRREDLGAAGKEQLLVPCSSCPCGWGQFWLHGLACLN